MSNNTTQRVTPGHASALIRALQNRDHDVQTHLLFESLIDSLSSVSIHSVRKRELIQEFLTWCQVTRGYVLSIEATRRDNSDVDRLAQLEQGVD